jgi:hypothetical protein
VHYVEHLSDLPQAWIDLLPQDHFLQPASLALYEQAALPNVSFGYALVWNGDEPVAAASFQILHLQEHHLNTGVLKPWQSRGWRVFVQTIRPKLLVSGHLFRHDVPAFYVVEGLEPFAAFRVYHAALHEAGKKSCAAAVLLKDPPEAMQMYFQQFAPEYGLLRADVSMALELEPDWTSFTEYEKALKHKYAQRTRNVRKAAAELNIRELTTEDVTASKDAIHALYQQVAIKQPVRLGYLSAELLPTLKAAYPDTLKVWGYYEGSTLVAFSSGWVKDTALDMFYIGFDYSRNSALQLYFNILFHAVEQAIALKKSTLILGRTALEAKARLGARPKYLQTFLHIRNPVAREIVARLQARFAVGEGEWESRHPFKSSPSPPAPSNPPNP